MKSIVLALLLLFVAVASADAHGGTVVRRGAFGRTVVVGLRFVPSHSFSRGFDSHSFNRGVFIDPRFDSSNFHRGNIVFDRFGRAIIIR
jgi:hypothetical protein